MTMKQKQVEAEAKGYVLAILGGLKDSNPGRVQDAAAYLGEMIGDRELMPIIESFSLKWRDS